MFWLPVQPPWLSWESHSQEKQRSICCTCSGGEPWRCLPRCRPSPPRLRPPWTCSPSWPGASWGCPRGRARRPEGSRRARPARSGWGQPIGRRSWTPLLQHRPSEIYGHSFPGWSLLRMQRPIWKQTKWMTRRSKTLRCISAQHQVGCTRRKNWDRVWTICHSVGKSERGCSENLEAGGQIWFLLADITYDTSLTNRKKTRTWKPAGREKLLYIQQ